MPDGYLEVFLFFSNSPNKEKNDKTKKEKKRGGGAGIGKDSFAQTLGRGHSSLLPASFRVVVGDDARWQGDD